MNRDFQVVNYSFIKYSLQSYSVILGNLHSLKNNSRHNAKFDVIRGIRGW